MANSNVVRFSLTLIIVAIAFIHATGLRQFDFLKQIEEYAYVARMLVSQPDNLTQKVVNVSIDDATLNEVGTWPWPKQKVEELVSTLSEHYRVQAVGLNLILWRPDNSVNKAKTEVNLSDSTQNAPIALGYYFSPRRLHGIRTSNEAIVPAPLNNEKLKTTVLDQAHAYYFGLPFEREKIAAMGFINIEQRDPNLMVQKVPLLMKYRGAIYESFSLALLRAIYGIPAYRLEFLPSSSKRNSLPVLKRIHIGSNFHIPVDENANVLLPSPLYKSRVRNISALDILQRNIDPELLRDRVVLVGVNTPNLVNIPEQTRFTSYTPTAVHASLLANILDQQLKPAPIEARSIDLLVLTTLMLCLIWAHTRLKLIGVVVTTLLCATALLLIHHYVWTELDSALPAASQLFMLFSITIVFVSVGSLTTWSKQRKISSMYSRAVSPQVIRELALQRRILPAYGEARHMSLLACSIRGYNQIVEKMSPFQLTRFTNQYLSQMHASIFRHRGTIDHYRYDQIVSFWGAPLRDTQHATHAIYAALDMQSQLPGLNKHFVSWGLKPIRMGIGIHTGQMNIATFGPSQHSQYNVFGKELMVALWLEQLSKHYGVNIIVSEDAKNATTDFRFIELDQVRFARNQPAITIYEPIATVAQSTVALECEIHAYHEALNNFRLRQWSTAKKQFSDIIVHYSGRLLYQVYLSRCLQFEKNPPRTDWDGTLYRPFNFPSNSGPSPKSEPEKPSRPSRRR